MEAVTDVIVILLQNMSIVFQTILTQKEIDDFMSTILQNITFNGACIDWTADCDTDGYPLLQTTFRGKRMKLRVQRLVYYLHHRHFLVPVIHVSHLCNNKQCLHINHLSYERSGINTQRKNCFTERRCTHHPGGLPDCRFW
jgi:hypothetical protein